MSNSVTQQKRFCYIYKTTQISTGKVYVGKHIPKNPEFDKNYFGSGKFIKNYVKSKGSTEGLKCEIVKDENGNDVCGYFTNEELNELEIKYIALYREKYGSLCMNFADGGTGGDTYSNRSEEDNKKTSEKLSLHFKKLWKSGILVAHVQTEDERKRKSEHMKGKNKFPRSNETKELLSIYNKLGIIGIKGTHRSEETKNKISNSRKGIEPYAKGKICITDGKNFKYVETENDIPVGWKRGSTRTDKICITDGKIDKYINKDDIIPDGFTLGSKRKNCIYITNGKEEKHILPNEKIPDGWFIGRLTANKKFINNGIIEKMINKEDKLPEGFTYGKLHKGEKIWITDGIKNRKINKNDIIPDGWKRGTCKK